MTGATAYCGFSRQELDREYSPSSRVESLQFYLDEYARRSASAQDTHSPLTDLRYGPFPEARLDIFRVPGNRVPENRGVPVMMFLHGGNWQELSKDESAFAAPDFLAVGVAFAAVGYGLAPAYRLDDIVTMARMAVEWLHANAAGLGLAPDRIHLCGTSAGAHLAAMTLAGAARELLAGVVLLSGMYDLEPLRHSYVNDALRLDPDGAVRNSPVYHLPSGLPPVVIARGGIETGEYIRQHDIMAALLRRRTGVTDIVCPARNHFDLAYDLGNPGSALGRAVLAQVQGREDSGPGRRAIAE